MRKYIACMLIAMMCLMQFPAMSVSASSNNSIDKVVTVSEGAVLTVENAPVLKIEESIAGEFENQDQNFRLRLTNATWPADFCASLKAAAPVPDGSEGYTYDLDFDNTQEDDLIEVFIKNIVRTDPAGKVKIEIPLLSTAFTGREAMVSIDPRDTRLTGATYQFAKVKTKGIVVSIDNVISINGGATTGSALGTISISETAPDSLTDTVQFSVNTSGFSADFTNAQATFSGGLSGSTGVFTGELLTINREGSVGTGEDNQLLSSIVISGVKLMKTTNPVNDGGVLLNILLGNGLKQQLEVARYSAPGLKNLAVEGFALTPPFDPAIKQYTLTVPGEVASLPLTVNVQDAAYEITVNGRPASGTLSLMPGLNIVNVQIKSNYSNYGFTDNYTINITRALEKRIDVQTPIPMAFAFPNGQSVLPDLIFTGTYSDIYEKLDSATPLFTINAPNMQSRFVKTEGEILYPNDKMYGQTRLSEDGRQIFVDSLSGGMLDSSGKVKPIALISGYDLQMATEAPSTELYLPVTIQTKDVQKTENILVGTYTGMGERPTIRTIVDSLAKVSSKKPAFFTGNISLRQTSPGAFLNAGEFRTTPGMITIDLNGTGYTFCNSVNGKTIAWPQIVDGPVMSYSDDMKQFSVVLGKRLTTSNSIDFKLGMKADATVATQDIVLPVQVMTGVVNQTIPVKVGNFVSSNTFLKNLDVKDVALYPSFSKSKTEYRATVSKATSSIELIAAPEASSTRITINGKSYKAGSLAVLTLKRGLNRIEVKLTADDAKHSNRTYTLYINRK